MATRTGSSRTIIFLALGANLLVAVTKFIAAAWTGSSAMFSEGVHSLADTGNELLLLYGMHRGTARPDREHPLGYGREVYFWSFAVALLVFALGAGVSLRQGIARLQDPRSIEHATANYIVLGISALLEGWSWWFTLHTFKGKESYSSVFTSIRKSKDPPAFIVLLEDTAALLGLAIAFIGIFLSESLGLPALDGVASILIGLTLAFTAVVLGRETKSLLIGERADQGIIDSILEIAGSIDGVVRANGVLTVHLAPQQIIASLSIEFADELKTSQIEGKVIELERKVRAKHPAVTTIFVKPQSPEGFKATLQRRNTDPETVEGPGRTLA